MRSSLLGLALCVFAPSAHAISIGFSGSGTADSASGFFNVSFTASDFTAFGGTSSTTQLTCALDDGFLLDAAVWTGTMGWYGPQALICNLPMWHLDWSMGEFGYWIEAGETFATSGQRYSQFNYDDGFGWRTLDWDFAWDGTSGQMLVDWAYERTIPVSETSALSSALSVPDHAQTGMLLLLAGIALVILKRHSAAGFRATTT